MVSTKIIKKASFKSFFDAVNHQITDDVNDKAALKLNYAKKHTTSKTKDFEAQGLSQDEWDSG